MPASPQRKAHWARLVTQICYALMLLMMVITSLPGQIPEQASIAVILSVKLLPLLILLPGLVTDSLRAYIWLCFIILFYFTQAVVESFLSLGSLSDLFITAISVILFISAMLYVKWQRSAGEKLF